MINPISPVIETMQAYLLNTPLVTCQELNEALDAEIWFKLENLQQTGSFKVRGALYALLEELQHSPLLSSVVTYSSGNHAQGLAWAGQMTQVEVEAFMPDFTAAVKLASTRGYGARVHTTSTRQQAHRLYEQACAAGRVGIPPFDHPSVILGASTLTYEALAQQPTHALFAPCGGGSLLAGAILAREVLGQSCEIYGCEPLQACDAAQSYVLGQLVHFNQPPASIADGARTLQVGQATFARLRKLEGFFLAEEEEIIYWWQWISHLLNMRIEPTGVLGMVGAWKFLRRHKGERGPLTVVISGGNLDLSAEATMRMRNYLDLRPSRNGWLS